MALTKQQALTENSFHAGTCTRTIGPRGGIKEDIEVWRRNGKTKTWKRAPDDFVIPVKYGLRSYGSITPDSDVHTVTQCEPKYLTIIDNRS
jgi:hypothetical protein